MRFTKAVAALTIIFAAQTFGGNYVHAETKPTTNTKDSATAKVAPVEDVTVTVNAGDTLSSIADAHDTTWVRIFNANESVANPDAINAGDKLRIPKADEQLTDRYSAYAATVAAQAQTVSAQTAATYTTKGYTSAPVNSSSYYVGNGMWCTDYVHSKRPDVPIYGNAGYNWISAAQANGKATGTTAQAGAVAVTNGHVAYVESVNPDGSYVVSEMGWNYQAGNYNQRTVQPGTFGEFIY
jgi:surface antigen